MHFHTGLARGASAAALTFVTLQPLPCGCVAGVYRTNPTAVDVELVEAKGPHCRFYGHRQGEVIALAAVQPFPSDAAEPQV